MANAKHLRILKRGVEAWKEWKRKNRDVQPDLSGADLSGASLNQANLDLAHLSRVDLSQADLYETAFADIDLTATIGLETCRHGGPSALDYRTLRRSPNLPLNFLRGCGLTDWGGVGKVGLLVHPYGFMVEK